MPGAWMASTTSFLGASLSAILGVTYFQQDDIPPPMLPPEPVVKHPQDHTFLEIERDFPFEYYQGLLREPRIFGTFLATICCYVMATKISETRQKNIITTTISAYRIGNMVTIVNNFLQFGISGIALVRSWPLLSKLIFIVWACGPIDDVKVLLENEDILRTDGLGIWSFFAILSYFGAPVEQYLDQWCVTVAQARRNAALFLYCYGLYAFPPAGSALYMISVFAVSAIYHGYTICQLLQRPPGPPSMSTKNKLALVQQLPLYVALSASAVLMAVKYYLNEELYKSYEVSSIDGVVYAGQIFSLMAAPIIIWKCNPARRQKSKFSEKPPAA